MLSWLSGLSLSSPFVRVFAGGLITLALAVAAYIHGYRSASARGDARLAAYQSDVINAQVEAARRYAQQLQAEAARADAAAVKLLEQQADIAKLTKQLQDRVSHVSTVYVDRQGSKQPLPEYPFTAGWVRDYNAALGLRMSSASGSSGESARASTAFRATESFAARIDRERPSNAELARSAVTQADVLTVHHVNAQVCRDAIAQLNAILDLYEEKRP